MPDDDLSAHGRQDHGEVAGATTAFMEDGHLMCRDKEGRVIDSFNAKDVTAFGTNEVIKKAGTPSPPR
jgi:hypothetical protein